VSKSSVRKRSDVWKWSGEGRELVPSIDGSLSTAELKGDPAPVEPERDGEIGRNENSDVASLLS
jgi:hypothetical protein